MSKLDNISIEVVTRESLREAADLIANTFCRWEPMARHLGCKEADFANWLLHIAPPMIDHGLSLIVRDKKTSRPIAACLRYRADLELSEADWNWYPTAVPVALLFGKLPYPDYLKQDPRSVLEMLMIGGLPPEEGGVAGITTFLNKRSLQLAKEKGLKYAVVHLSSPITQHVILNKFHFANEHELEFSTAGVTEFSDCPGKVILATLDLTTYDPPPSP